MYDKIIEDEGTGSAILAETLKGLGGGNIKVATATVISESPLQFQIQGLPDLLDKDDITILQHVNISYNKKIMLLSVNSGIDWVTLGNK